MTHLQKRIEAERKQSRRHWGMQGIVTKKNFFGIARSFGVVKAFRVLFSNSATALLILMA